MTTESPYQENRSAGSASRDAKPASSNRDDAAKSFKNSASGLLDDAKEVARSRLSEEKQGAASGIENVADTLREVVKRHESNGGDLLTNLAGSAADGLERLSGNLRNKDVGTMVRDVQTFARDQPVAFFGLTMAAGFLAVRFLKASDSEAETSPAPDSNTPYGDASHGARHTSGNARQEET